MTYNDTKPSIQPPPVPPAGVDLRIWLAGCALANSNITRGCATPQEAAQRAASAADHMLVQMRKPPPPRKTKPKISTPSFNPSLAGLRRISQTCIADVKDQKIDGRYKG